MKFKKIVESYLNELDGSDVQSPISKSLPVYSYYFTGYPEMGLGDSFTSNGVLDPFGIFIYNAFELLNIPSKISKRNALFIFVKDENLDKEILKEITIDVMKKGMEYGIWEKDGPREVLEFLNQ